MAAWPGAFAGMDYVLPVVLGVSPAAATGFRVFLPLLVYGIAGRMGYVPVGESFEWVTSFPALLMLAIAALAEIMAYYVPGVDNLLDGLAAPAALIAGISVSTSVMEVSVMWKVSVTGGFGDSAFNWTVSVTVHLIGV